MESRIMDREMRERLKEAWGIPYPPDQAETGDVAAYHELCDTCDHWQQRAEQSEEKLKQLHGIFETQACEEEELTVELSDLQNRYAELEQRLQQAESDVAKLAAALRKSWNCYAVMHSTPYEAQLKIFLNKHDLDRETFDRFVKGENNDTKTS